LKGKSPDSAAVFGDFFRKRALRIPLIRLTFSLGVRFWTNRAPTPTRHEISGFPIRPVCSPAFERGLLFLGSFSSEWLRLAGLRISPATQNLAPKCGISREHHHKPLISAPSSIPALNLSPANGGTPREAAGKPRVMEVY